MLLLSIHRHRQHVRDADQRLRDAEAINIAGSLRITAIELICDAKAVARQINAHRQLFQHALNSPVLQNLSAHRYVPQAVKTRYARLRQLAAEMNSRLQDGGIAGIGQPAVCHVKLISSFWRYQRTPSGKSCWSSPRHRWQAAIGIFTLWSFALRRDSPAGRSPLNQLKMRRRSAY